MRQTWRWFGPVDKVTISDARQAGAEGIVTALHHIAPGAEWPIAEIEKRKSEVALLPNGSPSGLQWEVVESLPVSEAIKTKSGDWRGDIERYKISLNHIAGAGIQTVCYNFMPVLDWTRTDLAAPMPHGGRAMRFDLFDFAAFDIFVLARRGAFDDYAEEVQEEARRRADAMSDEQTVHLTQNIVAG
jgi:mannonate dehydratase